MLQTKWIAKETVSKNITGLPGVVPVDACGETSYFYNPGRKRKCGTYFATIKDLMATTIRRPI